MSNLTTFWTEAYRWPVEKPGFVFLARAMNRIGKALYPTQWTGSEPWAEKVLPPLPESPGIDARIELTKDVERAYRLLGKELPPPVYARSGPSLSATPNLSDTASPDFGTGPLGRPPFAGTFGQSSREKRAAVGVTPLPQLVLSPAPALSDEEWAEARRRSIEIVNAAAERYERWSQVMVFTWRAFVTGTLECFLRNDDTGKYEGPTDADWWNFEGYVSRFGLCQMDKGRPTKQRHFERGHNIRSTEFVGSDFRLIFVSEATLDAALASAKSLEIEQPAEPEASSDRLSAIAVPPPRAAKGAKKGQGAKDDEAHITRILQMERDDGSTRYAATVAVATTASDGTETNAKTIERRLWRKVKDLPALPPTDTKTDTKTAH